MADHFCNALVRGIDIAPFQPTWVPLNCEFLVADLTKDLDPDTFPDGSVDLVHMRFIYFHYFLLIQRLVNAGVFESEWPGVMKEIYRMLKPGNGWIQCCEGGTPLVDPEVQPPQSSYVWQVCVYGDYLVS